MKTNSILDYLEIRFGSKDLYSVEELAQVITLNINRFDIDGKIMNVDFNDFRYFINLEELTISNCFINNNDLDIIAHNTNLKKLILLNCEIVDDIRESFNSLNLEYLVINKTNFDLNILVKNKLKYLRLSNLTINSKLNINVMELDIQRCNFDDILYFDIDNLDKLIISYSQYMMYKDYLDNYSYKIIIMEDNGQFVYRGES